MFTVHERQNLHEALSWRIPNRIFIKYFSTAVNPCPSTETSLMEQKQEQLRFLMF
jgi:hypothetical protein